MENDESYADACRACLKSAGNDYYSLEAKSSRQMFEKVADLKIEDDVSTKLCKSCSNMMTNFQQFKLKCQASNEILRSHSIEKSESIIIKAEKEEAEDYSVNLEVELFEPDDRAESPDEVIADIIKKENLIRDVHGLKNKHFCGLCDVKTFDTFSSLSSHLEEHKSDPACHKCLANFGEWTKLIAHRYEHLSSDQEIKCHICKKKISTTEKLHLHLRRNHLSGISCTICKKEFTKHLYLRKHLKYAHKEETPYTCPTCMKPFKTKDRLRIHLTSHDEKKYKCNDCNFSCKYQGGIKSHISRRHLNIPKIKCNQCKKEFKSKETFAEHMRRHKNLFICTECGKNYNRMAALKQHTMSHTGERPHACTYCPSRFKLAEQLRVHERTHTGERPYACRHCDRAFSVQGVLIKHERTHTGERPYVCQVCARAFTGGHNLKVHMRVHGEYLIAKKAPPPTTAAAPATQGAAPSSTTRATDS